MFFSSCIYYFRTNKGVILYVTMDIPFDFAQVEVRCSVISSLDVDGIMREKAAGSKVGNACFILHSL